MPAENIFYGGSSPIFWILLELVANGSPSVLSSVVGYRGAGVVVREMGHFLLDSQKNERIDETWRTYICQGSGILRRDKWGFRK